jgi:hypothetical protein
MYVLFYYILVHFQRKKICKQCDPGGSNLTPIFFLLGPKIHLLRCVAIKQI